MDAPGVDRRVVAKEPHETAPVGVVPDQPPVTDDDRVHRIGARGFGGQLVERCDHGLLVRHRHVEAADPQAAHRGDGAGRLSRRDGERHVDPVEPGCRERRVVDSG